MDEFDLIFKNQNSQQNIQSNQSTLNVNDEFDLLFKDKPITTDLTNKPKKDLSFGDYITDIGKSFAEGGKMGVSGILGLPGLIQSGIGAGVQKYQEFKGIAEPGDKPIKFLPTYSDYMNMFDKAFKYDPQTWQGEYAQRIGEYLPGSGYKLFNYAISGGAATLDQIVSKLSSEGFGDVAGFLTYLTSIPLAGKGRTGDVIQEAMPKKERLEEAEKLLRESREMGIPLTTGEAIGGLPMQQIAGDVASSTSGKQLSEFLELRREQIPQSVLNELQDITGKIEEPKVVFNTVTDAANAAIKEAKKHRSKIADYPTAELEKIDFKTFKGFTKSLIDYSKSLNKGDPLKLQVNSLISQIGQNKNLTVRQLDRIIRNTEDKISKLFTAGGGKSSTAVKLDEFNNQLIDIVEAASPAYKKARDTYREISSKIVDPLKDVLDPATSKVTYNTIEKLIFNPKEVTPTSIQKLAAALNKQDSTAFPKMASYLLDQMITNVSYKSKNPGFSIYEKLFSNPKTRQNVLTILEESARSKGLKVSGVRQGFDKMVKILKQFEFQPVVGSATSGRQERTKDFAYQMATMISNTLSAKPGSAIDAYAQSVKLKNTYKNLATMLTSEQGIKLLKDFGKSKKNLDRFINTVNSAMVFERSELYNNQEQQ